MELLCCNCSSNAQSIDWPTIIASAGAIAVGVIAIIFSFFQFKKSLEAEKMREERKEIHKKLDEFYGPLLQLRMKSNKLYQKFNAKFRDKDPNFATLTYLLNGHKFTGNDEILLKEILSIGEWCEKLMHDKAGLIDDSNLRTNIVPQATTHFLILRLAYKGALQGDAEMYKDLVFPKEIDELLEKRKKELEKRLDELNKL
jgi:hypothetical protein